MKRKIMNITAILAMALILAVTASSFAHAQETQMGYTVTGNYEIAIPAYIDLNTENQLDIEVNFMSLMDGYRVNVAIAEDSLTDGKFILASNNGSSIQAGIQVITNGTGSKLEDNRIVASYVSTGCEYGGAIQITPETDAYTNAGQYYGTVVFEIEMVEAN